MRAMVLRRFGGPLVAEELAELAPQDGEVIVRSSGVGLCATDLKLVDGTLGDYRLPLIPGHEMAGKVVETGAGVTSLAVGQHVVVHMCLPCGECFHCRSGLENHCAFADRIGQERPGGMAELVAVPAGRCVPLSPDVDLVSATIVAGTIATPLHALRRVGQVRAGETAVVIGVGGLGLHALQLAVSLGAKVVAVDVDTAKLDEAIRHGAKVAVLPEASAEAAKELTGGLGADVAVIYVGGPALASALDTAVGALRVGGRVVVGGYQRGIPLTFDSMEFVYRGLTALGARSSTLADLTDAVRMVEKGMVEPLVGARLAMSNANEALALLRDGGPVGRIVLTHGA